MKKYSLFDQIRWKFLNYKHRVKRLATKAKWYYNGGYVCTCCGNRIRFSGYIIEGYVRNKNKEVASMMFQNYSDKMICPACVYEKIEKHFDERVKTLGTCDFTNEKNVPVIDILLPSENDQGLNIRFGRTWWNGFSASKEAFRQILTENGQCTVPCIVCHGGKYYYSDRVVKGFAQPVTDFQ